MADDQPGVPGSGEPERPSERPTEPQDQWGQPPQPQTPPEGAYGQPGYGQPGYGQQAPVPYGYGPPAYTPPQNEASATAALVIAIAGFFICAPVGAIVALVLANGAQRRIEESGGRLGGIEQARAARIIAIVELALTGLFILFGALLVIGAIGANSG
jgi:hypothetical protein